MRTQNKTRIGESPEKHEENRLGNRSQKPHTQTRRVGHPQTLLKQLQKH